ncbi:MAG: hypothetical protein MJY68_05785 [Bacteroidaceae bacterium]|nr:hypothetical protein [Bacteroidaceae bacterium]
MKKSIQYLTLLLCLTASCTGIPDGAVSDATPSIYPDFTDITVPSNIASPNFMIEDDADKYITLLKSGDTQVRISGRKVCIPLRKWRRLTSSGNISITVYEKKDNGWIKMKPFNMDVASEIDSYVTYRLIPPSFQTYDRLSINQRDITNFKEKVIYANSMAAANASDQCINCHSFYNWRTDRMQFHIRQYNGGTFYYMDGKLSKLNLKTDSTISAAVYPSWHPTHDYIAYSNNMTFQNIHTNHTDRMEAFDEESDLVLYDIRNNAVSIIENENDEFECHPNWTPDGKTLFYVSAHVDDPDWFYSIGGASRRNDLLKYNLYSKSFNPEDKTWGKTVLYYDAAAADSSLTWPRVSPDGTKLLACLSSHGVFPPYQSEADLVMFDLKKGTWRYLDEVNSDLAESYHSWSSSGHWIVFSTRREDGTYTRLYLSYLKDDGCFTKPFPIPQKDPEFSRKFMYSYNVPEFTIEPIKVSARVISSFVNSTDAAPVSFEQKRGE